MTLRSPLLRSFDFFEFSDKARFKFKCDFEVRERGQVVHGFAQPCRLPFGAGQAMRWRKTWTWAQKKSANTGAQGKEAQEEARKWAVHRANEAGAHWKENRVCQEDAKPQQQLTAARECHDQSASSKKGNSSTVSLVDWILWINIKQSIILSKMKFSQNDFL